MELSARYAMASEDIVSESFDGDFVVLDLNCGKYFSFSDSANIIWEAVCDGVCPDQLLQRDAKISVIELESFIEKLVSYGLIAETASAPTSESASDYVDRLTRALEKPEVAVFSDLADLFQADPIHDVEEPTGWPAVRQA